MSEKMLSGNRGLATKPMDGAIRLWLVEEREALRALDVEALAAYGFGCERQFGSAEELIEVLRQTAGPDLLWLDNGLPGLSGAAAVRRIKSLSPSTLVFVIASLKNYCDAGEALGGGASAYFEKNASFERIAIAMRVALSTRGEVVDREGTNPDAVGIRI